MVGVPKSKGCKSCLRRKVRCDQLKPFCARCVKAGICCEGYPSRLVWKDEVPQTAETDQVAGTARPARRKTKPKPQFESFTLEWRVPESPSVQPLSNAILSTYLYDRFLHGQEGSTYKDWIASSLAAGDHTPANMAMQSFAAVFFASQHRGDQNMMKHAVTLYGRALTALNRDLLDSSTAYSHSNVSAAFALNLYELYASTQAHGWLQHAGGIASLMRVLGPACFAEYPAHGIFLLSRPMIIIRSYLARKPCFLGKEEWTTIPWQSHPETKTDRHTMLDLIACIPGLHAECVRLDDAVDAGADPEWVEQEREQLKFDSIQLGKKIISWRMEWEIKNPDCAWADATAHGLSGADDTSIPLFGEPLTFSDPERCAEILLYNSAMPAVLHFQRRYPDGSVMRAELEDWPEFRRPPRTNDLVLPHEAMRPLDCAFEVCRTVGYEQSVQSTNARFHNLLMPLGISMTIFSVFRGYEAQFAWLADFLRGAAESTGIQTFQRMISLTPASEGFDPQLTRFMPRCTMQDPRRIAAIIERHGSQAALG